MPAGAGGGNLASRLKMAELAGFDEADERPPFRSCVVQHNAARLGGVAYCNKVVPLSDLNALACRTEARCAPLHGLCSVVSAYMSD